MYSLQFESERKLSLSILFDGWLQIRHQNSHPLQLLQNNIGTRFIAPNA